MIDVYSALLIYIYILITNTTLLTSMTSMRSLCLECQVEGATIERLGQGILEHRNVVVEIHVTKLFSVVLKTEELLDLFLLLE